MLKVAPLREAHPQKIAINIEREANPDDFVGHGHGHGHGSGFAFSYAETSTGAEKVDSPA